MSSLDSQLDRIRSGLRSTAAESAKIELLRELVALGNQPAVRAPGLIRHGLVSTSTAESSTPIAARLFRASSGSMLWVLSAAPRSRSRPSTGGSIAPSQVEMRAAAPVRPTVPDAVAIDTAGSLLGAERDAILAALRRHRWHRTRAAEDLGIARQTLRERMKRLGIDVPGRSEHE